MSNKFAIYSGSTNNSVPPKFYWKNQKYKNLFGYAKNIEKANELFEKATGPEKWVQLVCLTTFVITKSYLTFNIDKPIFEGYIIDDEYD